MPKGPTVGFSVPRRLNTLRHRTCELFDFLKFLSLFGKNCSINGANLKADSTIDTSFKVYPIEISPFLILALAWLDACDRTCINAIRYSFADVCDDGVCHRFF